MPETPVDIPPETRIKPVSAEAARRRLRLRVAAKMMMYVGFAGVVFVFISALMSGDSEVPKVPSLRVDIAGMKPTETQFLTWEGRPILVYRRSDDDVVRLRTEDARLRDPASARSDQPDFAQNPLRSFNSDYFVAIALGTGQGCTVEFVPPGDEIFQGEPWSGGFLDSCGKDRYDLAGRVYRDQYAGQNLKVPQYTIDGETLVLGK